MIAQPDAVLCRLAARGNVAAYDALYQRYRQPVFAFVFHLLGRANGNEDAEDITQDVFTRAFAGIRNQSVDGAFRGWLFTIARNRTFDVIRGGRQKVVSLDAEHAVPPAAPEADEPAEQAEQRAEFAWLMTAVAELPERQREALLLREMAGFSHERIADELGTSVSATKKLISRGREGVGVAAASVGYGRLSRRRLGHDLALAAPIVPISITLASLGVTGGVAAGGAVAGSAIAGGGAAIGGKAAATALTVLAIGGGAVAVDHDTSHKNEGPQTAAQRQAVAGPVRTEGVANGAPGAIGKPPLGVVDVRRGRGSDDPAGDRRGRGDNATSDPGSGDRSGSGDSGRRGPSSNGGRGGDDAPLAGDDHGGRSGSGSSGSSNSDSNSGPGEATEAEQAPPPVVGDDGGSHQSGSGSGSDSGSGSGSSGSGRSPESGSGSGDLIDD
jgi:RNA polymerase sigma factor (sigma-70 family)